ncbi:MAG TPA: IclR family transcriptional regulator [Chloroflexota bacterium]|nr:IclR family transcriptional regulator [Chloroflexota bacterium]
MSQGPAVGLAGGGPRRRGLPVGRVQSLDRALDLLEAVAGAGTAGLPLKAVSRAAGLHLSTAHHLLSSLLARGYVEQDGETGYYRLGAGALLLANRFLAQCDLAQLAGPVLRRLHREFDEWVVLSALRGGREYILAYVQSSRPLVLNLGLSVGGGSESGLHCTAVGKVLLSRLEPAALETALTARPLERFTRWTITDVARLREEIVLVRTRGYATSREEHFEGLRAVAAPVFDATGRLTAALGMAYPTARATPAREEAIARAVRRGAAELSLRLGYGAADGEGQPAAWRGGSGQHDEEGDDDQAQDP